MTPTDAKTHLFEQHRRSLEGLSYRMLGTLSDAQDAVQETFLRWHAQDAEVIRDPRAWLLRVCTRLCLSQLKVAYRHREVYVGEWLPEPYFHETDRYDTEAKVLDQETLTMALLQVLETLTPTERAVFLLHDVFGLPFKEISNIVDRTQPTCRQLAVRARKGVRSSTPRFTAKPEEHRLLLTRFFNAANGLDLDGLVALLADQVSVHADGGGKVSAITGVLRGKDATARFFASIFSRFRQRGVKVRAEHRHFNGASGLLLFEDERLATALTIECQDQKIHRIYAVRNPDKLRHVVPIRLDPAQVVD